jgi:hypothetical protein
LSEVGMVSELYDHPFSCPCVRDVETGAQLS